MFLSEICLYAYTHLICKFVLELDERISRGTPASFTGYLREGSRLASNLLEPPVYHIYTTLK